MRFAEDGDARGALRAAERADALVAQVRDPLLRTNALNVHAHMLRVCGRYEAALEVVERMLTEAERTGLEFVVEHALLTKGAAMVGLRSLGAAREILRTLDKRRSQSSDHVRRNAAMVRARLKIAAGDLKAAALCLAEPVELVAPIVSGEFHSLRALIAAASGNASDASRAIERVRSGTLYDETTAFLALTGAVLDLEQRPESAGKIVLECLERGTVDAVVTACRAAPHLAERAVAGGARVELQAVFSCSHDADLGRKVGLEMPRELRRGEPLSPREREICELLVQGRTNREIAQTLFISESTTKVHLRHIFEKLAVHTRAEAAAAYLGHSTNGRGG
jgi:DNA-binding CsgD family transcriptional regulator